MTAPAHKRQRWYQVIRLRHASETTSERYTRHARNLLVILVLAVAFLAGAAVIGVRDLGVISQPARTDIYGVYYPPSYCVVEGPHCGRPQR